MDQNFLHNITGCFTNPTLPIDKLVDLTELIYFNRIKPVKYDAEIPVFNAKDIEDVVIRVQNETSLAKESLEKRQRFDLNKFPF